MVDYDQTFTAFTPEAWSQIATHFFKKKLVAAPIFQDRTDEISGQGDILHIPAFSEVFSAADVTSTSGLTTYEEVTDTTVALTLDQWKYDAFPVTDKQRALMKNPAKWLNQYIQDMGYSLAKTFDTAILALGASCTTAVGDSATAITTTVIESAIAILTSNSVPMDELKFIMHPTAYWTEVTKNSTLVEASKYGKVILPNAPHNELYGIPVHLTPNIPSGTAGTEGGHRNLLIHGSSFVYAFANLLGPKTAGVRVLKKTSSEHYRTKIMADIIYGKSLLHAGRGIRIISKN